MVTQEDMEAAITGQGALVRRLKKEKAPTEEIKAAVAKLLELKKELASAVSRRAGAGRRGSPLHPGWGDVGLIHGVTASPAQSFLAITRPLRYP